MPERSGLWFMEHARIPDNTKVLIMTGYAPAESVAQMMQLGASGCMNKPFGMKDLLRALSARAQEPAVPLELRIDHAPGPAGDHMSGQALVCVRQAQST
jgi:DNA-binding NtrC family response regulator